MDPRSGRAWAFSATANRSRPARSPAGRDEKASKQIATLTEELDALQQSVANIPALSIAKPASLPKAAPSNK
jgi:hypothetical protein